MNAPPLVSQSTAAIWLERGERKCIERVLKRERKWFPLDHEDPQEFIDRLLVLNDGKMKTRVYHLEYFSSGMRGNATVTIDVENKSRLSVADEAMGLLRGTFSAATQVTNITFPKIVVAP